MDKQSGLNLVTEFGEHIEKDDNAQRDAFDERASCCQIGLAVAIDLNLNHAGAAFQIMEIILTVSFMAKFQAALSPVQQWIPV